MPDWATIAGFAAIFTGLNAGSSFVGRYLASRTDSVKKLAEVESLAKAVNVIEARELDCSKNVAKSLGEIRESVSGLIIKDELRGRQIDSLITAMSATNKELNRLVGKLGNGGF